MKHNRRRNYYISPEDAQVDPDFDDIVQFESVIVDSIQRSGTLDIHPNGWGVHDGLGVNTDNMHFLSEYHEPTPAQIQSWNERQERRELERIEAARRAQEAQSAQIKERNALMKKIEQFPHATHSIAYWTAEEFVQFGHEDAVRRGITGDEWIWKRSRFMAGFK